MELYWDIPTNQLRDRRPARGYLRAADFAQDADARLWWCARPCIVEASADMPLGALQTLLAALQGLEALIPPVSLGDAEKTSETARFLRQAFPPDLRVGLIATGRSLGQAGSLVRWAAGQNFAPIVIDPELARTGLPPAPWYHLTEPVELTHPPRAMWTATVR